MHATPREAPPGENPWDIFSVPDTAPASVPKKNIEKHTVRQHESKEGVFGSLGRLSNL